MEEYLHLFQTEAEFDLERQNNYSEPWVSYIESIDRVDYNKTEEEKMLETPFTIEALGSGELYWDLAGNQLEYSKNGGPWTPTSYIYVQLVEGDEFAFKGVNTEYNFQVPINCTASFNVKGNIMSLVYGDDFKTASTLTVDSQFGGLFSGSETIVSAGGLRLPATTLTEYCYSYMFYDCINLTTAPALPATTLTDYCYDEMFFGCRNLTSAPALPATTLTDYCYYWMFQGCTSLTSAPALPATTLANSCYHSMFYGCTGLTSAPELPALTLVTSCYDNMFNSCSNLNYIKCLATDISANDCTNVWVGGVSGSGTFVKNPSMSSSSWGTGDSGIPTGWTIQ